MKRLLITTYFVSFESEGSKHDRFQRFWIWNTPDFIGWVKKNRVELENKIGRSLVVTNCSII